MCEISSVHLQLYILGKCAFADILCSDEMFSRRQSKCSSPDVSQHNSHVVYLAFSFLFSFCFVFSFSP